MKFIIPSFLALAFAATTAHAWQVCNISPGGAGIDDSPRIQELAGNCSSDAEIRFEPYRTFNLSTPVNFGQLENVQISIYGNWDLPQDIPYTQNLVNASGGRLYWFTVGGNNVTITGSEDAQTGWINAYGEAWWKAAPYSYPLGGLPNRPHGWRITANNSVIANLKISKPIAWGISLSGSNNKVYNNYIDAKYDLDRPAEFPFNTDGFDVSGRGYHFWNNTIYNGDDAVAVNNGAHDILIENSFAWGGHGWSLSGTDNISNITFRNLGSHNSLYATRFKSSLNSVGNISDVHWENIYIMNATFPIFATGVYYDQNTNRGRVPGVYPANSTATMIKNFTWKGIYGTINDIYPGDGSCTTNPCWYSVPNITNTPGITLQLLNGTASGISITDVNLLPIDGRGSVNVLCDPTSFTDGTAGLGFTCTNGVYEPTM